MPPLITYTFVNIVKDNSAILIEAYNYDEAVAELEKIVINPKNFQINP